MFPCKNKKQKPQVDKLSYMFNRPTILCISKKVCSRIPHFSQHKTVLIYNFPYPPDFFINAHGDDVFYRHIDILSWALFEVQP